MSGWPEDAVLALVKERFQELAEAARRMPPHIDDSNYSEADRQCVDSILLLMHALNGFIDDFRADLELLDYADEDIIRRQRFAGIASRDAAINLWNFHDALRFIEKATEKCPPLRTDERQTSLRAVRGRFGAGFLNAKQVRDTSAHPVTHHGTAEARTRNALRSNPLLIYNSRIDKTISHSREGRVISFEMTEATISKLERLRDATFAAFEP